MILKCSELQKERCDIVFAGQKAVIVEYMANHLYGSHKVEITTATLEKEVTSEDKITSDDLVQPVPTAEQIAQNRPEPNPNAITLKEGENSDPKVGESKAEEEKKEEQEVKSTGTSKKVK